MASLIRRKENGVGFRSVRALSPPPVRWCPAVTGFPGLDMDRLPEYVSFDAFDTLVLRPFLRPTDLFRYMEAVGLAPEGFGAARPKAEADARRLHRREITLDEIYELLGPDMQLADLEVETELRVCRGNPELMRLIDDIQARGGKVIVTSDMYLPQEVVSAILDGCGFKGLSRVFVSNAMGSSKFCGDIYPKVLAELGVTPDDVVHIGDNPRADVEKARRSGIRGLLYTRQTDRYFRAHPMMKGYIGRGGDLSRSITIGVDVLRWCGALGEKGDAVHELGYRFGGPMMLAYADYLDKRIPASSRSLFVSRDGYNLMRVMSVLDPEREGMGYIHAQRILAYVFTAIHIPFGPMEVLGKALHRFDHQKVVRWMQYILDFFKDDLGIASVPEDPHELSDLYNGRIGEIDALRRKGAEAYSAYVRGMVGDGDVHLVDCTTMKFTSQRLIERMAGRSVRGHYYVSLADADLDYDSFHVRDRFVFGWSRINVPEFFMSSPEPPIVGWKDGSQVYMGDVPEWERARCDMYGGITRGECDYARDVAGLFGGRLPPMGYDAVTSWSMLSADSSCEFRPILDGVKWASGPDHSDWSPLVPGPKDIKFLAKKLITDVIAKLNSA